LGDILTLMHRTDEARAAYRKGLLAARANYPDFRKESIERLEKLAGPE
jgi:predicted negative regulator of RcsB-dependent stress response